MRNESVIWGQSFLWGKPGNNKQQNLNLSALKSTYWLISAEGDFKKCLFLVPRFWTKQENMTAFQMSLFLFVHNSVGQKTFYTVMYFSNTVFLFSYHHSIIQRSFCSSPDGAAYKMQSDGGSFSWQLSSTGTCTHESPRAAAAAGSSEILWASFSCVLLKGTRVHLLERGQNLSGRNGAFIIGQINRTGMEAEQQK